MQTKEIRQTTADLLAYCRKNDWSGSDPYDALNSLLFKATPFQHSRLCRIALIQLLKRLPVNIRPLLQVPKSQNAKAVALFLISSLKLAGLGFLDREELTAPLIERLIALRSPDTPRWCWGYNFPWQTRTIIVPHGTPNLVCTVFVANALMETFQLTGEERCLEMALSAARYIADDLFWSEADGTAGFSYPLPGLRSQVHNANLLAAALLCRVHRSTGDRGLLEKALAAARYSACRQRPDGSWHYGEGHKQQWIDNFHTGYNLCALRDICQSLSSAEFEPHIDKGLQFYRSHFFREDGAARYFHDRTYPINVHCVAQSIITLVTFKDRDATNLGLAETVLEWAMRKLWSGDGYFYYELTPLLTNRISYMRWSQAWMLLALATLLAAYGPEAPAGVEASPVEER